MQGADGDEVARKRVEEFANKFRPPGFLVRVQALVRERCSSPYRILSKSIPSILDPLLPAYTVRVLER